MNGKCESCAALKAKIVELQKRKEELKKKVNPSFSVGSAKTKRLLLQSKKCIGGWFYEFYATA